MTLDIDRLWRDAKPDRNGLLPCVVQDLRSKAVLMVAWVSRQALEHALATGFATFWSRSRNELWEKGVTSGNRQKLVELRLDCDGDVLLYIVEPSGPACHEGHDTCFSRRQLGEGWSFEPQHVLGRAEPAKDPFAAELDRLIEVAIRRSRLPSRAQRLSTGGPPIQAEALRMRTEALGHALSVDRREVVLERASELLYDLALALKGRQLNLGDVATAVLTEYARSDIPPTNDS